MALIDFPCRRKRIGRTGPSLFFIGRFTIALKKFTKLSVTVEFCACEPVWMLYHSPLMISSYGTAQFEHLLISLGNLQCYFLESSCVLHWLYFWLAASMHAQKRLSVDVKKKTLTHGTILKFRCYEGTFDVGCFTGSRNTITCEVQCWMMYLS